MDGVSKEAQLSIAASSMFPGFGFSPTDDELISYYLKNKLEGPAPGRSVEVISEVDICNFEPWDLPGKSVIQSENEWFFFSPRGRKYPNGSQSRRATEFGYWKATGKERNVKSNSNVIGTKRTLVFHIGRAPKGERTEWIMHEYCMNDKTQDSMVVCRLRRNSEFHLNDNTNLGSSSRSPASTILNNGNAISEVGIDQGDKDVECYLRKSSSSHDSQSFEQIDSASESNQKLIAEVTQTESSGHREGSYDDDFYAEILNDDIIKLDESSVSPASQRLPVLPNNSGAEQNNQQPMQTIFSQAIPFQGTANRRIHLRRRRHAQTMECANSEQPPKALADRIDDRHLVLCLVFVFMVLLALFLSNFCFPDIAGSVSILVGRILSSKNIKYESV